MPEQRTLRALTSPQQGQQRFAIDGPGWRACRLADSGEEIDARNRRVDHGSGASDARPADHQGLAYTAFEQMPLAGAQWVVIRDGLRPLSLEPDTAIIGEEDHNRVAGLAGVVER